MAPRVALPPLKCSYPCCRGLDPQLHALSKCEVTGCKSGTRRRPASGVAAGNELHSLCELEFSRQHRLAVVLECRCYMCALKAAPSQNIDGSWTRAQAADRGDDAAEQGGGAEEGEGDGTLVGAANEVTETGKVGPGEGVDSHQVGARQRSNDAACEGVNAVARKRGGKLGVKACEAQARGFVAEVKGCDNRPVRGRVCKKKGTVAARAGSMGSQRAFTASPPCRIFHSRVTQGGNSPGGEIEGRQR
mmetsp:Transcript_42480/g.76178  ORF Transcript_42480/g.76178 Transcript_42480/m.76178 type:complete len:247 (-) Transcript_42480:943-1683(-)